MRERLRILWACLWPLWMLDTLLRAWLYAEFHPQPARPLFALGALALGACEDLLVRALVLLPLALVLALLRCAWLGRRRWRRLALGLATSAGVFELVVQYRFFEEFDSRYNHIALDYLIYPTEVVTNIWQSYNVPATLAFALALGLPLGWLAARAGADAPLPRLSGSARALAAGGALLGAAGVLGTLWIWPARLSEDRVESEIAANSWRGIAQAFATSELPFELYYATLPRAEARARAARALGFPAPSAAELAAPPGEFELQRELGAAAAASARAPLDIVVVLEESFGSRYVGVLGNAEGLTPGFDRWSERGLLLTQLIANGNRTVRGLEGVLCSFAPLPPDSITKRPKARGLATLASLLAAQGYETAFFYGGRGRFDHMRPFMLANGWQRFVEQDDLPRDAFATSWGAADEHIFDALIAAQRAAHARGQAFFGTLMSVSNHLPFQFPAGRIARAPGTRRSGIAYADWALARYLDEAERDGLLAHTAVLVVGDHGARVYGSEEIPVRSYRIPALFLLPDPAWRGQRIGRLCSQIDLAPTLLELAGLRARAPFLGQSLIGAPETGGRALVQHNRDIGLMTEHALVVLELQKHSAYYRRAGVGEDRFERVAPEALTPELRDLEQDAIAIFQTADELYQNGRYVLP